MSDSGDYVVLVPYNGSATGTGGDPLKQDLNVFYNVCSQFSAPQASPV